MNVTERINTIENVKFVLTRLKNLFAFFLFHFKLKTVRFSRSSSFVFFFSFFLFWTWVFSSCSLLPVFILLLFTFWCTFGFCRLALFLPLMGTEVTTKYSEVKRRGGDEKPKWRLFCLEYIMVKWKRCTIENKGRYAVKWIAIGLMGCWLFLFYSIHFGVTSVFQFNMHQPTVNVWREILLSFTRTKRTPLNNFR